MQREIEGLLQVCPPEKEAQRKPYPGNIQEQLAWGSDAVEDIPDYGRVVGLLKGPFQCKLFYASVSLSLILRYG